MGNTGLQILADRDAKTANYADAWLRVGRAAQQRQQGEFERKAMGIAYEQVSLKAFFKACKAGDVLLIREKVQIIPNVFVPSSIARQVATSSTTGRFGGEKQTSCPMWTRGGVICLNDGVKSVIEGTPTGIEVRPLKEVLKALRNTRAVVAVRALRSSNKAFYASQLAPLVEALTTDKGVQWTTILVEKRQAVLAHQQSQASQPGQEALSRATSIETAKSEDTKAPGAADDLPPEVKSAEDLTKAILYGVKKQVLTVHPSMEYEALRVFYQLDERGSGELSLDDCLKAVSMLADQAMPMGSAKATRYLQDRTRALFATLLEYRGDECKRRDKTTGDTQTVIRFEDFLEVFRALPLLYVPVEHDIQGILAGQTVMAVYRYLRVVDIRQMSWTSVTISNFSSRSFVEVDLDVDHLLDREVLCQIK